MSEESRVENRIDERMTAKPPAIAERLLQLLLPEQVRDNVSGDLSEMFSKVIVPSCGILRARLWYWRQVAGSTRLFFRFRRNQQAALELWKGRIHMDRPTHDAVAYHPGISMHHIQVGGGMAGFLFVLATVFIFGVGFPAFLVLLGIAGVAGILASRFILYWHRRHALKLQALDLHKRK